MKWTQLLLRLLVSFHRHSRWLYIQQQSSSFSNKNDCWKTKNSVVTSFFSFFSFYGFPSIFIAKKKGTCYHFIDVCVRVGAEAGFKDGFFFLRLNFWVLAHDCDQDERKCDQKNGTRARPEKICDWHRKDFSEPCYYNLTLSESFCLTDHEKQVQKFVAHWKVCQKSSQRGKLSGRMRTKRQNRKECCFLRCFSSSPGRWQTSKLPQEGRVLSDQKIDVQTTLLSRSQLESSAGKPFTFSSANQTPRQELRTTPLQGARMEGSATSEGQNDNFFYRTKVFSKRQHDHLSFSCMHAKNGGAGATITTKK